MSIELKAKIFDILKEIETHQNFINVLIQKKNELLKELEASDKPNP